MLVNTLETVAKDLINILAEADRKYFEYVHPNGISSPPTPLAAPLPEYFTFELGAGGKSPVFEFNRFSAQKMKEKINRLSDVGDLTKDQANLMTKRLGTIVQNKQQFNFDLIFADMEISMTKKEDLVFKLIHTGHIDKPQDTELTQKQPKSEKPAKTTERVSSHKVTCDVDKRIEAKKAHPKHSSTPKGASPKKKEFRPMLVKKREKENGASPVCNKSAQQRKRNDLRARSITPGAGDQRKGLQNSRTPVSRRHK